MNALMLLPVAAKMSLTLQMVMGIVYSHTHVRYDF